MGPCLKRNKTDRLGVAIVLRLGSLVVRDVGSQQLSAIWLDSEEAARDGSRGPTANQPGTHLADYSFSAQGWPGIASGVSWGTLVGCLSPFSNCCNE